MGQVGVPMAHLQIKSDGLAEQGSAGLGGYGVVGFARAWYG
jgi:hypothetical protein